MDPDQYKKNLEKKISELLQQKLEAGKILPDRAETIARLVLETLKPYMDMDHIYKVAENLEKEFPELIPVLLESAEEHEEKIKEKVLARVHNLIQEKKIEEADELLEKALDHEVSVDSE